MYDTLKYNSFCRKTLKYDTFCRETLKYGTFCRKNLDYALRAEKMANLRGEPTPHFMLLCQPHIQIDNGVKYYCHVALEAAYLKKSDSPNGRRSKDL